MFIQFKYRLSDQILSFIRKQVIDFDSDSMIGWFNQANAGQFQHCSLYIICELETYEDVYINRNPILIVGKNTVQAMEIYNSITGSKNGTILCEVVNNCSNIKVIPTGVTK